VKRDFERGDEAERCSVGLEDGRRRNLASLSLYLQNTRHAYESCKEEDEAQRDSLNRGFERGDEAHRDSLNGEFERG
jgi:hypothetical protein